MQKSMSLVKKIKMTLHCGKLQSQENLFGTLLGEMEDQDGTLSAQLWLELSLDREWIFILEESILSFLIMKISWLNPKLITTNPTGSSTLSTWATCTSTSSKCRKNSKIS